MKSEEIENYKQYKEGETNAQLVHKIVELRGNELGLDVKISDISVCPRLSKRRDDKHPPIIVRFVARKVKQIILYSKSKLKEKNRFFLFLKTFLLPDLGRLCNWKKYNHVSIVVIVMKTYIAVSKNFKLKNGL